MYHFNSENIREKILNDFNNSFCFLKKIREGNVMLEIANKVPNVYKSDLNEMKKEETNRKGKKAHCFLLRFTK